MKNKIFSAFHFQVFFKDGVERYFFYLAFESKLLNMNSGIINRCLIFMQIEKLACNCVVFLWQNILILFS